jgi:hypothetical protein
MTIAAGIIQNHSTTSGRSPMNRSIVFFLNSSLLFFSIIIVTPQTGLAQPAGSRRIYPSIGAPGNGIIDPISQGRTEAETKGGSMSVQSTPIIRPSTPLKVASTYTVISAADTGIGTLRRAIDSSNADPDPSLIAFAVGEGGAVTITLKSSLPDVKYPVIIDGTTQPGYAGAPIVELSGTDAGSGVNGLKIVGGSSIVRGLVINNFRSFPAGGNGYGIVLDVLGGNLVEGNYIGLNVAGTDALPNNSGVGIFGASGGNAIGGTSPGSGNVVSGNRSTGIAIASGSVGGNIIRGNFVGTSADGSSALGNGGNGIFISAPNDTIGGLLPGSKNVVSANTFPGIFIGPPATRTVVLGNYVGTDVTGTINLGTGSNGINIRSSDNIIGDESEAGRNIIAGGGSAGMYFFSQTATRNSIVNNFIGTDVSGTVAFGNTYGIVFDDAPGNVVGGRLSVDGNLIAGNTMSGITMLNATATGNAILSNLIGTNTGIQQGIGNYGDGITIHSSTDTVRFNTIAFNNANGIFIAGGSQNTVTVNSIYSNGGMGIDLGPAGIAVNDSLDADTGANNLQNFPILDSSRVLGDQLLVRGRINGTPNTQLQIDFYTNEDYNPSHFGEGREWSTFINVTTDGAGNASFAASLQLIADIVPPYITATATDPSGNTSEFSQALGTLDSDGDGILDAWETENWGIDVNSDGKIDLDLYAKGARPDHKDIFVEIDAMAGMAPASGTLDPVIYSFDTAPDRFIHNPDGTPGIKLHCLPLDEISLTPVAWPVSWWDYFAAVKSAHFGTREEQADSNARFILEAKKLVYRYCIYAFTHDTSLSSGIAENTAGNSIGLGGNDFMVTLGNGFGAPGGTEEDKAGTFMHELGHTLGLRHGGADTVNYKPNYISIMNYSWQFKYKWGTTFWTLDYSTDSLPMLDESQLYERDGFNLSHNLPLRTIAVPFSGPDRKVRYARLAEGDSADWDNNGAIDFSPVAVDLNVFDPDSKVSPGQTLRSETDWDKLVYNFRNSSAFSDAAAPRAKVRLIADDGEQEMTSHTYLMLNNLPPPVPHGVFSMDGKLDSSAVLVATNSGIDLYASYKDGQLYVATNSAQALGNDMYILVTDKQYPLRIAPSAKAGQVAGWSVYLRNRAGDNSTGWFDSSETPVSNIAVDTAGEVLEGVIDLEYLYGNDPSMLFLAVGRYDSSNSGALLGQAPAGDGGNSIEIGEFYQLIGLPVSTLAFVQQGNKLVGGGEVNGIAGVAQGTSVSISGNGTIAIAGGPSDNNYAGAAWIFTRNGETWSQQGSKLVGTGASGLAYQGYSVAISADGTTAIVGGYSDNNSVGAAWVFVRNQNGWNQQGNKLVCTDFVHLPHFGQSVALSSDGNTALIGGPIDNNSMGAAWIFVRHDGNWRQQGPKLVGTGSVQYYPWPIEQGYSVALSGDGNTAMIGSYGDDSGKGAVWIFTRNDTVWSQQGNKLVGSGAASKPQNSWQGSSAALSFDGNTTVSGGLYDDSLRGAVWVFTRNGTEWTQQGSKLFGTDGVGRTAQGGSVSLSGDGNTLAIGGFADSNNAGAAWVFVRSGGIWSQLGKKLVGTGAANSPYMSYQGTSVAMSGDGNTLLVGGPGDDQDLGASWVFTRQITPMTQMGTLTATIVPGGRVQLDWTTLSENSNQGFQVERSSGNPDHFDPVSNGFVPGYGTSSLPHSYSFIDSTPGAGSWFYRLKLVSLSGTYYYSTAVPAMVVTAVNGNDMPKQYALRQSFPNPFNPTVTIAYQLPEESHVRLVIFNILGQKVEVLRDVIQRGGYWSAEWNGNRMPSGVYFYRLEATPVTNAGKTFTGLKKMVLLK